MIISFLGLSVFLSIKLRNCDKLLTLANYELILFDQKINDKNEKSRILLNMDAVELDAVCLVDSSNNSIPIQDLVKTPKFIFRFSEGFCKPCIESTIVSLNNLGDNIGIDNIIIISNVENSRLLKIFINGNNIQFPCYSYSGKFDFEIEKLSGPERIPYYFVLDSKLKVSFPFFTDENSELNFIYLNRINRLFNQQE